MCIAVNKDVGNNKVTETQILGLSFQTGKYINQQIKIHKDSQEHNLFGLMTQAKTP